jgi:hypothetical protein
MSFFVYEEPEYCYIVGAHEHHLYSYRGGVRGGVLKSVPPLPSVWQPHYGLKPQERLDTRSAACEVQTADPQHYELLIQALPMCWSICLSSVPLICFLSPFTLSSNCCCTFLLLLLLLLHF